MNTRPCWFYISAPFVVLSLSCGSLQGALIGVDFNLNGASPTNWTRLTATNTQPGTTPTPITRTNLVAENGVVTNADFSLNSSVSTIRGFDNTPTASTIPTRPNSIANIGGYFMNDLEDNDTLTAIFRDLNTASLYKVWVFNTRTSGVPIDTNTTITGGGSPITFRSLGANSNLLVNGQLGSSARTLDSYALLVQPSNIGEITFAWTEGPTADRYSVAGVAIEPVPEPASASLLVLAALACASFTAARPRRPHMC